MSYNNNDSGNGLGVFLFLLVVILIIFYYTLQLALLVIVIFATGASLWGVAVGIKNFYLLFRQAHKEANLRPYRQSNRKFIFPHYEIQPARLMYFYDAGWSVILYVGQNAWRVTRNDARKLLDKGQNLINQGHRSSGYFQKFISLIRFYSPGLGLIIGWLFHFVATIAIVGFFIGLQFLFLFIGVIITTILTALLGIGTYLYGSFYKIYYRCPNCHEQMNIPVCICSKCSEKHTRLWPSVYGIFHHTCLGTQNGDLCRQSLPTLIFIGRDKLTAKCPNCDYELAGLGGTNVHIPIIGNPYAGKSCFMFMAVNKLINEYGPQHGLKVTLPDHEHQKKYGHNVDNYLKVGRFLQKTVSSDYGAKALNLELKTSNQAVSNLIHLYDTAGEDYDRDDKAELQNYFKYGSGIVLVIDPFSIPHVHKKYESQLKLHPGFSALKEQDLDDVFQRLLFLFETKTQPVNKKFIQPFAVTLTKTDILDLEQEIGATAARRYLQDTPGTVHTEEDAINILVEEFLNKYGADNFVRSLRQYFSNVRFFSCSVVGTDSDVTQSFRGERVLDPLLWVLETSKMLPNKAPFADRIFRSKLWIKYGLPILITGILSSVVYGGYSFVRWSLDVLYLRFPSSSHQQNMIKTPVKPFPHSKIIKKNKSKITKNNKW